MTEPLSEIALPEEEIDQILRSCDGRALPVGGQALAFWAQYDQVKPLGVLSVNVTSDADFVGTAQLARELSQSLKPHPQGIAQAHLAIEVVSRFLDQPLTEKPARGSLDAIERLTRMAQEKSLETVFHDFGLDPLSAVRADRVPSEEFRTRDWPQILTLITDQRHQRSVYNIRVPRVWILTTAKEHAGHSAASLGSLTPWPP